MSDEIGGDNVPLRKRGRPAGKRRVPLSLDQRRARNAQYERERRNETTEAMAQLAAAAGCEPGISNADLLITVINKLQKASDIKRTDDIEELKHINDNLMSQIEMLESRLNNDPDENYSTRHSNVKEEPKLRASPEIENTSPCDIYEERTKKRKRKKMKLNTDDGISLNAAYECTTNEMTNTHVNPKLKQENQCTIKIEMPNELHSNTIKPETRTALSQDKSPALEIELARHNTVEQTKSQPGPNIRFEAQYLKSARAPDYFTHKELNTSNHIVETGTKSRISTELSNNMIPNEMKTELTQEMPRENNKTLSILNLLTENEKGHFGDTEWLTECTYNNTSARDSEVHDPDWTLDNLIANYLQELN